MIKINKKLVSLLLIGTLMFAAAFFVACAEKNTTTAGGKTGAGGNTTDTLYEAEVFQLKVAQASSIDVYSLDVDGPNEYTLKNNKDVNVVDGDAATIAVTNKDNANAAFHLLGQVDFEVSDITGDLANSFTIASTTTAGATEAKEALNTAFGIGISALSFALVIKGSNPIAENTIYNKISSANVKLATASAEINAVTATCGSTTGTEITCTYASYSAEAAATITTTGGVSVPVPEKLKGRTAYKVASSTAGDEEAGDLAVGNDAGATAKNKVKTALNNGATTGDSFPFHVLEFESDDAQDEALVALATTLANTSATDEAKAAALNAYVKAAARATTTATPVTLNVTADLSSLD